MMTPAERLMAKVDIQGSGCWLFTGSKLPSGYGKIWGSGKLELAHRFSHRIFIGPIPDGYQVDHLCRQVACVNPAHLEAVTPRENNRRSSSVSARFIGVTTCSAGHELTPENSYCRPNRQERQCRKCRTRRRRESAARTRAKRRQEAK